MLPLLPSGPDGVCNSPLRRTRSPQTWKAEREGFEPPVPEGYTCFRGRRLQPLGHLSRVVDVYGERGIRTLGTRKGTQHFQCCPLSRSCISPPGPLLGFPKHCLSKTYVLLRRWRKKYRGLSTSEAKRVKPLTKRVAAILRRHARGKSFPDLTVFHQPVRFFGRLGVTG